MIWDCSIGLIAASHELLGHRGVEMFGDPGATGFFGIGMQIVFREAILAPESGEGSNTFLLLCTRNGASSLPAGIAAYLLEACECFTQHGIVEATGGF